MTSHLIATACGKYHAWVDMGIYFSDDEMRKQAELLLNAPVTTGQEPLETVRCMRKDVYKKHISADPAACRLPYAILTKMVALRGWKRYEMNETMRFSATGESSFNSIMRKSLVVVHKACFVPEADLMLKFPNGDAAAHGYVPKDPTLRDFLASPRAGRALLLMVLSFT